MLNLSEEAQKVRNAIELIAGDHSHFFSDGFPINACKHASQIFCYHLGIMGFEEPLSVVFGVSKKRGGEVGHWWVESEDFLIDLTADQFNIIDDRDLSYKIREKRDYLSVYCCLVSKAPHYNVFSTIDKQKFTWDLSEISDEYIEHLELDYEKMNL
ncbi:hypothetical protein [Enterovibrio norvegicus]|uniref:hypothetical protein n=1 Tax=Enterovibrio norvegicus TaxID=188144 RepID=UPI00354E1EE4